jgi:hypothetical protein
MPLSHQATRSDVSPRSLACKCPQETTKNQSAENRGWPSTPGRSGPRPSHKKDKKSRRLRSAGCRARCSESAERPGRPTKSEKVSTPLGPKKRSGAFLFTQNPHAFDQRPRVLANEAPRLSSGPTQSPRRIAVPWRSRSVAGSIGKWLQRVMITVTRYRALVSPTKPLSPGSIGDGRARSRTVFTCAWARQCDRGNGFGGGVAGGMCAALVNETPR